MIDTMKQLLYKLDGYMIPYIEKYFKPYGFSFYFGGCSDEKTGIVIDTGAGVGNGVCPGGNSNGGVRRGDIRGKRGRLSRHER
jgi:hypothetical protein